MLTFEVCLTFKMLTAWGGKGKLIVLTLLFVTICGSCAQMDGKEGLCDIPGRCTERCGVATLCFAQNLATPPLHFWKLLDELGTSCT